MSVKTRFLILSDTHSASPLQNAPDVPFRSPLPQADVLIHCGDLTMVGLMEEYVATLEMLRGIDAGLKLVIAGNHDISLDGAYYARKGQYMQRLRDADHDMPRRARELWTGEAARQAGVTYLDEGTYTFTLRNGALLRVYASPYQPEFCDWAFAYARDQDRFNEVHQSTPGSNCIAEAPVPGFPGVDVIMTHGPPYAILDATTQGEHVGCKHLLRAARRCRPQLHCFGHIHEGWGAKRVTWNDDDELAARQAYLFETAESIFVDKEQIREARAAYMDVSRGATRPLDIGKETLMVNASIMSVTYRPWQGPWVVDLDLKSV